MDGKLILKNRLREARMERDLSQSALAELVGVSRNTISSIETGQFQIPPPSWPWCCASPWTKNSRSFSTSEKRKKRQHIPQCAAS